MDISMKAAAMRCILLVTFFLLGFVHVNCKSDLGSDKNITGSEERALDVGPQSRISGGTAANKLYKYSFVARIVIEFIDAGRVSRQYCNGAYVWSKIVLTSASCFRKADGSGTPEKIEVYFEKIIRDKGFDLTKFVVEFSTSTVFIHPQFNFPSRKHDLAIIKIPNEVSMPFPPININKYDGHNHMESLTVAGWGKLKMSDDTGTNRVQYGRVTIISNDECEAIKPVPYTLENKICTKGPTRPCEFDEGSPFVRTIHGHPRFLIAIGSTHSNCDPNSDDPDMSTRVSRYYEWIHDVSRNKIQY